MYTPPVLEKEKKGKRVMAKKHGKWGMFLEE